MVDKKDLSERDICTKFITPAPAAVGWTQSQFREEVKMTDGRIIVRGKLAYRLQNPEIKGGPQRADYVLYANGNIPIAVIEAKRAIYEVGHGMQQALNYAEVLDAPIAISSNGAGFLLHDRTVKKNYEIYLCLYQVVTGMEEWKQIYLQFPDDFFDLVVIDECHRGSANEDSAWREVLDYFQNASHLGMTATPKERRPEKGERQIKDPEFNLKYFGNPIYTYSLRQGIEDGFLAPYKVIRVVTDADALGYTPEKGKTDKDGQLVEQRQYNTKDFDRNLILTKRTELVAKRIWEYLEATDPMAKTIVFCDEQPHAERMRQELVKLIPEAASNRRYVVRITGDDKEGKAQLSYFIDNDEPYPVIATTSRLLSTGVDANGKLVTEDYRVLLKDQIRKTLRREFASLDDFLRRWTEAERKQAVIDELKEQDIPLEVLREAVPDGDKIDAFDLVAHIAFDQPPLSRKERADKVKKRNYFGKYGEEARAVLEALFEKYADHGIANIEDPKILELPPFDKMGSKTQIRRRIFGGPKKYSAALTELEQQIYQNRA